MQSPETVLFSFVRPFFYSIFGLTEKYCKYPLVSGHSEQSPQKLADNEYPEEDGMDESVS
jgi:hypothetical protein